MTRLFALTLCSALFFGLPRPARAQEAVTDFSALLIPSSQAQAFFLLQNLTDVQFMRYAFLFSGLDEKDVPSFLAQYENLAQHFGANFADSSAEKKEKMAEAVLEFLFSELLKKYSLNQTRVDEVFKTGVYNCVSSAVVYYALCLRNGIDVRGVKTRDHAFCAVTIGSKSIDVETTNRFGFDPGNKKEFSTEFGQTGFAYVSPSNYRGRTDIGARELVCLILQNRIADLQRRRNHVSSLRLATDLHAALQTPDSLEQLFIECANYAAVLDTQRKHEDALDFLTQAAHRYGQNKLLADTADKVYYNLFVTAFEKRTGVSIQNRIERADKLYAVYARNPLISTKTRRDVLVLVYNQKVGEFFTQENWSELFMVLEVVKRETANDSRAVKLERNTLHNIGVLYHNKFASLFNKGDRQKALVVLQEGLSLVPNNKTLLNDYEQIKKLL